MSNHSKFLKIAKDISKKSDHHSFKIGCVITKKAKIIGKGFNSLKTNPNSPDTWHSCHAEFRATLSAKYEIEGSTVYLFRENKNGDLSISRPCCNCWNFLKKLGAKTVVYTENGSFKTESFK